jgi:hypothetical protein
MTRNPNQEVQPIACLYNLCGPPGYDYKAILTFSIDEENFNRNHDIILPSLTCDPTTVKDLKRTPAKASLCDLKKLQEWVRTVTTSYRGLTTFPHAHGLCSCITDNEKHWS